MVTPKMNGPQWTACFAKGMHTLKNLKWTGIWQYHSEWENKIMWFASHLKYIFFIGMGSTFSLNILFLFETGKPVTESLEWDLHYQKEYPFWECTSISFHFERYSFIIDFSQARHWCRIIVIVLKVVMSIFDNQSISIGCIGKLGHLFGFLRLWHYLLRWSAGCSCALTWSIHLIIVVNNAMSQAHGFVLLIIVTLIIIINNKHVAVIINVKPCAWYQSTQQYASVNK